MTASLSERAMLVSLNVRMWQATRTDKTISTEVATRHKVSEKRAGHYRKHAIDKEAPTYKAVVTAAGDMRTTLYKLTQPWGQDGARILSVTNFEKFSDEIRQKRQAFEGAVRAFVPDFHNLVRKAQAELNSMFNANDYPSNIAAKFGVDVVIMPMPDASDFRASLSKGAVASIREAIAEELSKATETAMQEPYERLYKHINRMVDRLGDKKAIFRDTLVTGLAELCQILPGLNLTNDKRLEALRKQAEELVKNLDPNDLRETPVIRKATAQKAKAIQDVMAAFMGPPGGDDEPDAKPVKARKHK